MQLLIQGERRALALSYGRSGEAMLVAVVQPVEERLPDPADDAAFLALDREVRRRAEELGRRRGIPQDALNQLLDNPSNLEAMGAAGKRAIEDAYNWGKEEQSLYRLYQNIALEFPC